MWHWNWRSFFRIQVVTAVLLVMAYGVLIVATFFMASFSAASTGTQRAVSEVERALDGGPVPHRRPLAATSPCQTS